MPSFFCSWLNFPQTIFIETHFYAVDVTLKYCWEGGKFIEEILQKSDGGNFYREIFIISQDSQKSLPKILDKWYVARKKRQHK
jgi:hypothetical protein